MHLAAFKALAAESRGALKTKSLHGELVHNLSGTKHVRSMTYQQGLALSAATTCSLKIFTLQIGESFKRYGITPETKDLIVGKFDLKDGEVSSCFRMG